MNDPQTMPIIEDFCTLLEQLRIPYAIGGSIASSIYGNVRFTADAYVTVEAFESQANQLLELLKSEYYVSSEAMHQAFRDLSSFNVIHIRSAFKIDVFICKNTPFEKQLIPRRRSLKLSESAQRPFEVVSPEDIILLKLRWYHAGGRTSERQWNDVLGMLSIQGKNLDFDYLKKWADNMQINELLKDVISQCKG